MDAARTSAPSTSASSTCTSAPASVSTKSATTSSGRKQPTTSLTAGSASSSKKAGSRGVMTWSDAKDLALLLEVASVNPFSCKKGSKERGKCWTEVGELLSKQGLKVDQRAVRDRYTSLQNKNKQNNNKERKASGISPELTPTQAEMTQILEDLAQQDADSETVVVEKNDEEQKKIDGVEMRKRLVETFAETNKRLTHTEENEPKRRRHSGNDVTSFMAMKLEMEREARAQELQIKKDEAARREVQEEREQERRRQVEAENARKEAEKERKFELLQQQLLQQSNQISSMLMLLMQQQQNNK